MNTALTIILCTTGAYPDTPIAVIPHKYKWKWTHSTDITTALNISNHTTYPNIGLRMDYISTCVMHARGDMALLNRVINYGNIKFLGL